MSIDELVRLVNLDSMFLAKIGFVINFQVHLCVPTTIPNQVIFSSMGI